MSQQISVLLVRQGVSGGSLPSSTAFFCFLFISTIHRIIVRFHAAFLIPRSGSRAREQISDGDMVVPLKKAPHVGALLGREAATANRTFGAGRVRPGSLSLWNNAGKRKPKSLFQHAASLLHTYTISFFSSLHYATSTCEPPPNWVVLKVLWQLFSPSPVLALACQKCFDFPLENCLLSNFSHPHPFLPRFRPLSSDADPGNVGIYMVPANGR